MAGSAFCGAAAKRPVSPLLTNLARTAIVMPMATTQEDRLQIRVEPKAKRLLEEAAAASHLTVSAFVLQAAEMRADQVLLDRETIRLSPRAAAAFASALAEPATVNKRLAKALTRPRDFTWAD